MSDTDSLVDHFRKADHTEVDHAISLYLEPTRRITHHDTEVIREHGYKIQDIENQAGQTKVTLAASLE